MLELTKSELAKPLGQLQQPAEERVQGGWRRSAGLLWAEARRIWTIYWRYPLDFVSGLVVLFITFFVILTGVQYVAGPSFQFGDDRLSGLILGYWLWNLSIFAFSYTATALRIEAVSGTLEQIYLSPFGTLRVFCLRSLASLAINVVTSTVLLGLLMLVTGRQLSFPPEIALPLLTTLMAAYGIGLGMAALTLLFKQTGEFFTIVQFLILPAVFVPFESLNGPLAQLYSLVPIAPSAEALRSLMTAQVTPEPSLFLMGFVNGAIYLAAGTALFFYGDRLARKRGVVGLF
ncbi:MAG: ABC transporter permease [Acidobacteriota bacterium]